MADPRPPVRYLLDLADVTKLDPIAAQLAGWCAYYAYYDSAASFYASILGAENVRRIPADPATGRPQGWIFSLAECNIVVFCGTTSYSQLYGILRDTFYSVLSNCPANQLAGLEWAGFAEFVYSNYASVLDPLMIARKTIFCGHSLGGAIAAVLCRMMRARGTSGAQASIAYTFGCPRLGNVNLARSMPNDFNIVNPGDVVPKLPHLGFFRPLLLSSNPAARAVWPTDGFTKHGVLTYIQADGNFDVLTPGVKSDPRDVGIEYDAAQSIDALLGAKRLGAGLDTVKAIWDRQLERHFMASYVERLDKNLPTVAAGDGLGPLKEAVYLENQLPPAALATIERITPPPTPFPRADDGVIPKRRKTRR